MSYNLKNKNIVLICLSFAIMMTVSNSLRAEEAVSPMDLDTMVSVDEAPALNDIATEKTEIVNENAVNESIDDMFNGLEDEQPSTETIAENEANNTPSDEVNLEEVKSEEVNNNNVVEPTEEKTPNEASTETSSTEELSVVEAPKSPFENFGNTILARVDNDLFNQMSNIEKQTTLLNLELKREEVRNKVEALKAQREKAIAEEAARKIQEEQKIKELELEREMKLLEAQEKIKEKEIELEKVRQAKLLNDYMNEMLLVNQKWVEKNAELQNKVAELQQEHIALIKEFEEKMDNVKNESSTTLTLANTAKDAFNRMVTSYKSQIRNLKKSLTDKETAFEQLKSGNSANPFADLASAGIDENAIDMSNEYAIMDITGTGNEIIAKIVAKDGTTFIVHKGSMLKGGEVVTAITDNFVAFDKNGIKSYLYTGGTVREYEPSASFNDNDKLDKEANAQNVENSGLRNVSNVRGIKGGSAPASSPAQNVRNNNQRTNPTNNRLSNNRTSNNRSNSVSNNNNNRVSGKTNNTASRKSNSSNKTSSSSSAKKSSGPSGVVSSASGMFVK